MKLLTLDDYQDQILDCFKKCYNASSADRNRRWFDPNNITSLVNRYKRYPYWTFLVDDNNDLIAMSCIQKHFFPENCYRVLTRTYYYPGYRRAGLNYEKNYKTLAMYMLEKQLEWLDFCNMRKSKCDMVFFSVEFLRRKNTIKLLANKLNTMYGHNWKVLDGLYQTYNDSGINDKESWQTVCVWNKTNKEFPLKHITVAEWEEMKHGEPKNN